MTTWFPIGPDFVFSPRDAGFKRLSRHNENGRQGLVNSVALDPTDASTIYTAEAPTSGGNSAFRSDDDGESWTPIVDGLQQADPGGVTPSCVAVHPINTGTIYLGTFSGRVYVSPNTKGATWGSPFSVGGTVFKIVVDPRTASSVATSIVYAASSDGVWRSNDGGSTFTRILTGNLQAFAARFPTDGSASDFYAGVSRTGVFHATDPASSSDWTNLNTLAGTNLPAIVAGTPSNPYGNFDNMRVDFCRLNRRAYIWFFNTVCDSSGANCNEQTASLFTSANPTGAWTPIAMTSPPNPAYGLYDSLFAVTANSPGDGSNDILIFGSIGPQRSIDSGRTWTDVSTAGGHADQHAMVFFPDPPPSGVVPATYIGCDGGLAVSLRVADPTATFPEPASDWDDTDVYTPNSPAGQNYNHGKQSSAIYAYNSPPGLAALGYIGCQDTGLNAGNSALGWRGIFDADGGALAAAQGSDGVKVWFRLGSPFSVLMATDTGDLGAGWTGVNLTGDRGVDCSSNFVVDINGDCLGGVEPIGWGTSIAARIAIGTQTVTPGSMAFIEVGSILSIDRDANQENVVVTAATATTFTAAFTKAHAAGVGIGLVADTSIAAATATGSQTVIPGSMRDIVVGARLVVDTAGSQETVTVSAVTATTFTASFTKAHGAGTQLNVPHHWLARFGQDGSATPISADFYDDWIIAVGVSPTSADVVAFATHAQRLFLTTNATATPTTWTEVTGAPSGLNISTIVIDPAGNIFVLNNNQITIGGGEFSTITPLFLIASGTWTPVPCSNVPSPDIRGFGRMVADPVQPNILYVGHDARVYQLVSSSPGVNCAWTDLSGGLPGQWIYDLWIGNIGTTVAPKVLLRAAVPSRGVWEIDVTTGATDPALGLYVRDNILDMGRLPRSPAGVPDPYHPADPGSTLYHYECADIKVDALQSGASGFFFQTDPEGTLPLSHVWFDQLVDNSDNLPGADSAMVHVQVRNRGLSQANNVHVWAMYCNASAGVPSLAASASQHDAFAFWSQFTVTGQILPSLPSDSPWHPIGPPQTLSGIDAGHPLVASWTWTVPTLPSGDPGHYCIVTFVHSSGSPINETGFSVDDITPFNKQIGQKNLHIGPPLPSGGGGGGGGGAPGASGAPRRMREYIEFHNPTKGPRTVSLVIDTRGLPPEIRISFVLTQVDTVNPLPGTIVGVKAPGVAPPHGHGLTGKLLGWFDRIEDELEHTAGALLEWLGCWVENLGRRLEHEPPQACAWKARHLPKFVEPVYTVVPGARVEVPGVKLPAGGSAAALISIENRGNLPPGSRYKFQVQQWVGGVLVGGSTYVIRIAGNLPVIDGPPQTNGDSDDEGSDDNPFLPPWIDSAVDEANQRLGK